MSKQYYSILKENDGIVPNAWDLMVAILIFGVITALGYGASNMLGPYSLGDPIPISLAAGELPKYASMTCLRMAIALIASLLFTLTVGSLAAKNKHAEKIILPFIDIMQSIPPIGVLGITALAFVNMFPGSMIGPECAAIFVIFTSQVWNMVLSFYQSLKVLPKELKEVAIMFNLSTWQKFWRIEVPFALPSLLWNTMISMSAAWFYVVASEAISVANQEITLEGIGSYMDLAVKSADYTAFIYAVLTIFATILIYDQLLFRPLIAWSEKFQNELTEDAEESESWFLDLLRQTNLISNLNKIKHLIKDNYKFKLNLKLPLPIKQNILSPQSKSNLAAIGVVIFNTAVAFGLLISLYYMFNFLYKTISLQEVGEVFILGLITLIKISILILLSSIIWVPVGVWVGSKPKLVKIAQPIIQFLAAFPAQSFYPILCISIISYDLNVEIWTTPLMILGTQWYILFNVIAGTSLINKELYLAAKNFKVSGWLKWKRLILPGIFPSYVTGAMAAAGGCWNATVVADIVSWGDTTLRATGLGGYIAMHSEAGDTPRLVLGLAMMCFYVLLTNKLLWHKLYEIAEERFNATG